MDRECLEKVQRRAVVMVSGLTGKTYKEKIVELGMLTLEERRHQTDICLVHKIMHREGDFDPRRHGSKERNKQLVDTQQETQVTC
jgi:hypothetical protein